MLRITVDSPPLIYGPSHPLLIAGQSGWDMYLEFPFVSPSYLDKLVVCCQEHEDVWSLRRSSSFSHKVARYELKTQ